MRSPHSCRAGTAVAVATVALLLSTTARAAELGRPDLAAALYSNQFGFNGEGEPVVRVGIADGLSKLTFSADGPVAFEPEGAGGSRAELSPGDTWSVTVHASKPARTRTWVGVERVQPPDEAVVAGAISLWRTRGYPDAQAIELGAVFGFAGEVMDSRHTLIAVGGTEDPEAASALAERLRKEQGIRPVLTEVLDTLPEGEIRIQGRRSGVTFRNRRVFRVSPLSTGTRFRLRAVGHPSKRLPPGVTDPAGRTYRGALYFAVDRSGRLAVGNSVGAEELLRGLVPTEIYARSPSEALKAQAVTARNEVLAKLGTRHLTDPYLLCDDIHCQAYPGAGRETARTSKAVEETRGRMLFREGKLVDAVYSASCGGHSEANQSVWPAPADPALQGAWDGPVAVRPSETPGTTEDALARFLRKPPRGAYCKATTLGSSNFRWRRRLDGHRLTTLVNRRHNIGRVQDLRVTARGPGGRVEELTIEGAEANAVVRGELTVRRLFGNLKSGMFILEAKRAGDGRLSSVTFIGGGFGHGVGMCQSGTIGRAEAGQTYDEILGHYYGGAEVRAVY
jgi:stage II sporulation protein D